MDDARQLGYCTVGEGKPVIYFHGTASSRLEVLFLERLAQEFRLQLIGVDRPGYGLSTFQPRKKLQHFNEDVNALADHLGIDRFGIIGWSGGGAFALTYLACFPQRVSRALVAGAPALPFDVSTAHNMPFARYVMKLPFLGRFAVRRMRSEILRAKGNVDAFLRSSQGRQMLRGCSKTDLKFLSTPGIMTLMHDSMVEAFRQGERGVEAVLQEHRLFIKPWTFSPSRILAEKLTIWHGSEDRTCRLSNAEANARRLPGSTLEVFEGWGHFVMFQNFEKLGKLLD